MNLAEVRRRFVLQIGLAELVNDYPDCRDDAGADYYINEGQKFLDGLLEVPGSRRSWPVDVAVGDDHVLVEGLRDPEVVSILGDSITKLTYQTPAALRTLYPEAVADIDNGTPLYWSIMYKTAPKLWRKTASDFAYLYPDILYGADDEIDGICFRPSTDTAYTVEVSGLWYSRKLQTNEDVSWWSVNQSLALIQSAALMVEMFFNNSTGIRDKMDTIQLLIRGVDHNAIHSSTHAHRIVG